jgi:hypothetical protein
MSWLCSSDCETRRGYNHTPALPGNRRRPHCMTGTQRAEAEVILVDEWFIGVWTTAPWACGARLLTDSNPEP